MPHKRLITKVLQRYWRLTRGLSLEVRGCAQDASGRVLLVRPSGAEPWRLPGGRVFRGETAAMAVKRWLEAEGGLQASADPRLAAVQAGTASAGADQIALYLIPSWLDLEPGNSPSTRAFFAPGRLPQDVDAATVAWIKDANDARTALQVW